MAKGELSLEKWTDELDEGFDFRRRFALEDTWVSNEALFFNVAEDQDNSAPNIILSTGDALLSSLAVPFPHIEVNPERYDALFGSTILTRLDNKLVGKMRMRKEVAHAVLCAYLYSCGFLKIGYDSEFGWDPELDVLGGLGGMTLSQVDRNENLIEFNGATPGMPWVESVLPHDIVVPWGTIWMQKARWVAHRVVRHVDEVRADPKYEHTRDLEPNMSMRDFTQSYQSIVKPWRVAESRGNSTAAPGTEDEQCYVELFEIHDRRTRRVYVFTPSHDKFLRNEVDHLQVNGKLPFTSLGFVPHARSLWRTPDATYLRQAQAELLDVTIQSTKQRRLSALKFLVSEGAMDESQLELLLSPHVGAAAKVKAGFSLNEAVHVFQPSQNSQIYMEAEQIRRNARESVGLSRNQVGEFEATGRRTATEAGIVDTAAQARSNRRLMEVAELYTETFEIVNALVTKFWGTPRMVDVLGENGAVEWKSFVGKQLEGEYSYSVTFSQDAPLSPSAKRQQALQLYQGLAMDPSVDQLALRQYVAGAFNDPTFSALFKPGVLPAGGAPQQGAGNASLPLPMQRMQGGGGRGSENGRGAGQQSVPPMQGRNA